MPKDPIEELTKAVRDATSLQSIEHLSEAEIDELRQLIAHEERGDAADFAQSRMAAHFGDGESNTVSPAQKAESAIGREMGRIEQLRGTDPANIRCIDTETTGLEPGKDEILQVSVVDGNGNILFDSLVKPTHRKRWPKAAEINGITPDMVKDKPNIEDIADDIGRAMRREPDRPPDDVTH